MALPRSIYSTPGMRGMGDAGFVPADDPFDCGGLQIVFVARTQNVAKVRCPRFGFMTTLNRKGSGGKPIRNGFLALQQRHVQGRPDIVALVGIWLLGKDDLPLYYTRLNDILNADPTVSKKVYKELAPRSAALYGIEYFHAELRRRAAHTAPTPAASASHGAGQLSDSEDAAMLSFDLDGAVSAALAGASPNAPAVAAPALPMATVPLAPAPAPSAAVQLAPMFSAKRAAASYGQAPPKRRKEADLPGTVKGMVTENMGRWAQIKWDLGHHPLCTCPAKGTNAKHAAACEQGVLLAGKKAAGYDNRGNKKK